MSITVMLEATLKKNKLTELQNLLEKYLPQTREQKGFQNIDIYRQDDSNKVIFYSIWDTKKDYENYLNWRIETGVMNILAEVFETEPAIKFYNNLNI